MYKNIRIVKVDSSYCDYLRQYDERVPYNYKNKELRPFIGILFEIKPDAIPPTLDGGLRKSLM